MVKLGVIADDFTGGSDIASFMVNAGWRVVQIIGQPTQKLMESVDDVDAIVISLKSRSNDPKEAIDATLAAAHWLKERGAQQLYFKYCSTFDSTAKGNIGPVTDALVEAFNIRQTVFCPALPINGRTVLHGYLFVNGVLLNESGMQYHPITPMKDANLVRVLSEQTNYSVDLINYQQLDMFSELEDLNEKHELFNKICNEAYGKNVRYFIVDCAHEKHLKTLAELTCDLELITGGSGLAEAIAKKDTSSTMHRSLGKLLKPESLKTIIFSGSCSVMTNQQVAYYQSLQAPTLAVDVERAINDAVEYAQEIAMWAIAESSKDSTYAPLIYATQTVGLLIDIQNKFGAEIASKAIEDILAKVALILKNHSFKAFIVAGGETSGAITQALSATAFEIGKSVAPGVPWVKDISSDLYFLLKSGNFGTPSFFANAQE